MYRFCGHREAQPSLILIELHVFWGEKVLVDIEFIVFGEVPKLKLWCLPLYIHDNTNFDTDVHILCPYVVDVRITHVHIDWISFSEWWN